MFHPCHIRKFECDTGGTLYAFFFKMFHFFLFYNLNVTLEEQFCRGHPALWIIFIFSENNIQTIWNWSAKKKFQKIYSLWYPAVKGWVKLIKAIQNWKF